MSGPFRAVMTSGEPDSSKRSCFDCHWCQGYVSWWCMNDEARKRRRTSIPGTSDCPEWIPVATVKARRAQRAAKPWILRALLWLVPTVGWFSEIPIKGDRE